MNYSLKKNIFIFLIICICISAFTYFLYNHYVIDKNVKVESRHIIDKIHDAKLEVRLDSGSVPSSAQGIEFNVNFWMYINDYNYRQNRDKTIFKKGESIFNPMVLLEKDSNNIKIVMNTHYFNEENNTVPDSELESESEEPDMHTEEYIVKNIKLQKWININISLVDTTIDVFIDGKLTNTFVLNGYPIVSKDNIVITPHGGFNGFLNRFTYINKAFSPLQIKEIYHKGPN